MTKIYLAGRVSWGEDVISDFAEELESRGHQITCKWWELGKLPKPYLDNYAISQEAASLMVRSVVESDVTILFAEDNVLGAATEFGVAIGDKSKPRDVYVVLPEGVRQSVFYSLQNVITVNNIDAIRSNDWY